MTSPVRIVLTRAESRNQAWGERLSGADLPWTGMPLVRYASLPLPEPLDLSGLDWVILTSPQGVRALADRRLELGSARFAVLGHGTARAVASVGWTVDFNAGALDGAAFVRSFLAAANNPGTVLLPGPRRRLREPRASLEAAGYTVRELPLYETLPVDPAQTGAVVLTPGDVVFFCSPSAVRSFAAARDDRPRCVAIGRTTAEACQAAGFAPLQADTPDLESMVRAAGLGSLPGPGNGPVNPELES